MTGLLLVLLLAPDDAVKDDYWGYEIKLAKLEMLIGLGDSAVIYRGRAGNLRISVRVIETAGGRAPSHWLFALKEKWNEVPPKASGPHWAAYEKKDRLGFSKTFGYAYFTRGDQTFELRAESDGTAPVDDVRRAIDAFEHKKNAPGTLVADRLARTRKKPRDDPHVLLAAGIGYLFGHKTRTKSTALAGKVFAQARAKMKPGTFSPKELWSLYEFGGLALDHDAKKAIEWLTLAEQVAGKIKEDPDEYRRKAAYNLAGAYARAKKPDEAFAALYRAYDGGKPVTDEEVSGDVRLESLRRDERWHKFWRQCVKR